MAKEFTLRVGQEDGDDCFNWVIQGMGKYVAVTHAERVDESDFDVPIPGGETEYIVYHTGPDDALYSVPGEGFIYPDSPLGDDGIPIPKPWNP